MFHHRAGWTVEVFNDVERAGNILEVGLGKTVLAVLESLHVHDGAGAAVRTVECGGLVRVCPVPEIVGLDVSASADLNCLREVSNMFG